MRFNQTRVSVSGEGMVSQLLMEIARQERLQEWMQGIEKRISMERRLKVKAALRRELEKCQEEATILEARIARLESEESKSQAS
jgi:hypothetical protein